MGGGGNEWSWGLYDIDFVARERRGGGLSSVLCTFQGLSSE